MDYPPKAFKMTVTQSYDVYIWYQQGFVAAHKDDLIDIPYDDAIDLAFNEDGLHVARHEDTETSNGYIALVETFDPDVKMEYSIECMPAKLKQALDEKLSGEQQKELMYG